MGAGYHVKTDVTPEERRRLQQAWRRLWISQLLILPAALIVVSVVQQLNSPAPRPGHHQVPIWVVVLITAGVVLVLLPLQFWFLRRRFFHGSTTARALIISGDRRDVRRVYRALRRGETVGHSDRPIAQAYVDSAQRQLRMGPWFVGGLVILGALAVGGPATTGRPVPWFVAVMMTLALVMFGYAFVQLRRTMASARQQGLVPRGQPGRTRS